MQNKKSPREILIAKHKGQPVQIRTAEYFYWGRIYECDGYTVALKPYYTNKEKDLRLHTNTMELKLDEIVDVE